MAGSGLDEQSLWNMLNAAESRMTPHQMRFWEAIRIPPQKWKQTPHGEGGGGFWVIGILGGRVVWYNDIEEGFNHSAYAAFGEIGEYLCNQDRLEHSVQRLLDYVRPW
jgi:hypothetical protein